MRGERPFPNNIETRKQVADALATSPWLFIDHVLGEDAMRALRSLRWLRRFLEGAEDYWVRRAYDDGQTFMWIGGQLGRTRQAVRQRYLRAPPVATWRQEARSMLAELGPPPEPEIAVADRDMRFRWAGPLRRPFPPQASLR